MNWNGRRIIKNIFIYNIPERGGFFFVLEDDWICITCKTPMGAGPRRFWGLSCPVQEEKNLLIKCPAEPVPGKTHPTPRLQPLSHVPGPHCPRCWC